MPTYRYQMKRPNGQVLVGTLKADNQTLASQQVHDLGGTLLDLTRIGDDTDTTSLSQRVFNRISSKDTLAFTNQLSVMSKAGLSLTVALESISEQLTNPRMRTIVATLKRDVEAGRQFSEALQRFPKIFSLLYVNMVRASELSGTFARMLERFNDHYPQSGSGVRKMIEQGNNGDARISVHGIKGVAANLCMEALHAASAALETELVDDGDKLQERLQDFERCPKEVNDGSANWRALCSNRSPNENQ